MAYGESDNYNANITGPQPSNLITAGTAALNATGTASAANPARKSITIQNQGPNTLYIALGAGASATVYHFSLNGCVTAKDGKGGSVNVDDYTGIITAGGTSPSYTVTEFV